jgi:hypothetical protein
LTNAIRMAIVRPFMKSPATIHLLTRMVSGYAISLRIQRMSWCAVMKPNQTGRQEGRT